MSDGLDGVEPNEIVAVSTTLWSVARSSRVPTWPSA